LNSERETILTLKDVDILDEKYEDVLVNVNIVDTERTKAGQQLSRLQRKDKNYLLYNESDLIDGVFFTPKNICAFTVVFFDVMALESKTSPSTGHTKILTKGPNRNREIFTRFGGSRNGKRQLLDHSSLQAYVFRACFYIFFIFSNVVNDML
jgi:hypothetical protein